MDFNNIRKEVKPGMYGDDVSAAKLEAELARLENSIAAVNDSAIFISKTVKQLALTCKELMEYHNNELRVIKQDIELIKCRLGLVEDDHYGENNTEDNVWNPLKHWRIGEVDNMISLYLVLIGFPLFWSLTILELACTIDSYSQYKQLHLDISKKDVRKCLFMTGVYLIFAIISTFLLMDMMWRVI